VDFYSPVFWSVVGIILTALVFDYLNGFHDAANSIATVVSTRVLTPGKAVIWASFFNFAAAFIFGTVVAKTIGKGMVRLDSVDRTVIFAGLLGAIVWNIITWYFGLPTSSSHALIGGYAGSAVAKGGFGVIIVSGWTKTLLFIVLSPVIGMVLGFISMAITMWATRHTAPRTVDSRFRKLQLFSAAAYSLGHGTNDAQKTMGIIASVLFTSGYMKTFDIPLWVIVLAHSAIAMGTLSGGWRIVKTMGQRITALRPVGGFCAESAAAVCLFGLAMNGIPVSTTHTITGAIIGVGSTRRLSAVRWAVTKNIVWAWIVTIPAAALIAALVHTLLS
jgi:PiT family inorganic phosphate transporter